jgi:hypothetical protein
MRKGMPARSGAGRKPGTVETVPRVPKAPVVKLTELPKGVDPRYIAEVAAPHVAKAIGTLVRLLDDAHPEVAMDAARHLLDRVGGGVMKISVGTVEDLSRNRRDDAGAPLTVSQARVALARLPFGRNMPADEFNKILTGMLLKGEVVPDAIDAKDATIAD